MKIYLIGRGFLPALYHTPLSDISLNITDFLFLRLTEVKYDIRNWFVRYSQLQFGSNQ